MIRMEIDAEMAAMIVRFLMPSVNVAKRYLIKVFTRAVAKQSKILNFYIHQALQWPYYHKSDKLYLQRRLPKSFVAWSNLLILLIKLLKSHCMEFYSIFFYRVPAILAHL